LPVEFMRHRNPAVRTAGRSAVLPRIGQHYQAPTRHAGRNRANHHELSTTSAQYQQTALEADLQDLTPIAHEPSSFRSRKSDRPKAADSGQLEPSVSLIGSPGR